MKIFSWPYVVVAGLAAIWVGVALFLASQSARAETAAARLDVFRAQMDNPAARAQFEATRALLAEPRDARLMELESVRLQRIGTPEALRQAALLAAQALAQTPARPTLRMHDAFILERLDASASVMNQRLAAWHDLAPHDGTTQPWRLAIGIRRWSSLAPDLRAKMLDDAEDVCVRSGKARTLDLAGMGQPNARLAIVLRLSHMQRTCAQYPADAPPILR